MNTCLITKLKHLAIPYFFVTILGILLHFTYEWSGNNFYVGLFSATNESTWEHLKLIFFPMLILTVFQFYKYHKDASFLIPRTAGIFSAMLCTVVLFYTLNGVFGSTADFVNILIYFAAVAYGFLTEHILIKYLSPEIDKLNEKYYMKKVCLFLLFFMIFVFFFLTDNAPNIGIFRIPNS